MIDQLEFDIFMITETRPQIIIEISNIKVLKKKKTKITFVWELTKNTFESCFNLEEDFIKDPQKI